MLSRGPGKCFRRAGLPIVDLGAALAELEARGEDPYYWPVTKMRGHWNHATHQTIAHFVAEALARESLLWSGAHTTSAPGPPPALHAPGSTTSPETPF